MIRCYLTVMLVLGLQGGCQLVTAEPLDARLGEGDVAARALVQKAMQEVLGVPRITLARDAFGSDSLLTLEPGAFAGFGKPDAQARMPGRPEQFRLQTQGGRCILLRVRTGESIPLVDVLCQPVHP